MTDTVSARYAALAAEKRIERDPAQEMAAAKLTALEARLSTYRLARKSSSLGWLFGHQGRAEKVRGIYLYGDVGRGKTMLMDLFFATCPVLRKRRVHFHEFMTDVHDRIYAFRQQAKNGDSHAHSHANGNGDDAIMLTANAIADEAWLLCFDEFHVTDIADAMILGRLFTQLFARGVVVVATSNCEPDDLYRDGLNRELFLPFVELLKERMDIVRVGARTDFRLQKLVRGKVWHTPADAAADAALDRAWMEITLGQNGRPLDLAVKGRVLHVPLAAHNAARFSFDELCGQPLGPTDYLRLAREFHTIVIDHVPVMDETKRNEAKRFINLIDTLYDNGVKIVASAEAEPQRLYRGTDGNEAFEFHRTASRLIEMGSQSYLALPHGAHGGDQIGGLIDT
jgi:cell division protein ZapE